LFGFAVETLVLDDHWQVERPQLKRALENAHDGEIDTGRRRAVAVADNGDRHSGFVPKPEHAKAENADAALRDNDPGDLDRGVGVAIPVASKAAMVIFGVTALRRTAGPVRCVARNVVAASSVATTSSFIRKLDSMFLSSGDRLGKLDGWTVSHQFFRARRLPKNFRWALWPWQLSLAACDEPATRAAFDGGSIRSSIQTTRSAALVNFFEANCRRAQISTSMPQAWMACTTLR